MATSVNGPLFPIQILTIGSSNNNNNCNINNNNNNNINYQNLGVFQLNSIANQGSNQLLPVAPQMISNVTTNTLTSMHTPLINTQQTSIPTLPIVTDNNNNHNNNPNTLIKIQAIKPKINAMTKNQLFGYIALKISQSFNFLPKIMETSSDFMVGNNKEIGITLGFDNISQVLQVWLSLQNDFHFINFIFLIMNIHGNNFFHFERIF